MLPPLDTLPAGLPERTLGWGILSWALTRFVQPDGPDAGKPYRPTDRQVRFLLWAYEVDEDGRFTHRHLVRRLAKGSGKARGPRSSHVPSYAARSGSGSGTTPVTR